MPNRLAQSQSLYLRKHADNPIDWYPWGDEALEKARTENKPIFLSIGYSSCHWCTVMEHEAFSDTVIADYMNDRFVAIKVDREERPDLDSIYLQSVQIMGESGGWPLNLFLAPDDLVPFYGGTYFPIEPRYGRPGFLRVLQSILEIYHDRNQDIQDYKEQIVRNLHQVNKHTPVPIINDEVLANGIAKCAEVVTNRDYGTCFPMIPYANFLLRASRFESLNPESSDNILKDKTQQRGLSLALGGIFDHVAGGWHRYTVDHTWTVPHFEKMLYDNGLIMEYLA
ncbi:MAG: thioredoxin domain-containing protein, partial [Microcystis sp. M017S1]|uniref:thioredoxin domain-containing protein n=1 Tax=Microcystis sp. M017S1 TaxID=2771107 RepID=UPI0025840858